MLQLKVGIHLPSLKQPFKKALHTAAQLGATAVEIDARRDLRPEELSQSGLRHIAKTLDDLNLRVSSVTFPTRRGYDVAEDLEPRLEATKRAMKMAYQLGANCVVNQIGRIGATEEDPSWNVLLQSLTDLGTYSQHIGAFLAAESGPQSCEELVRLNEALPAGCLNFSLNPGNLLINGFDVEEFMKLFARQVVHMYACDGVRDLARGRGLEVPVGQGSVDFPSVFAYLEEAAFQGTVTIRRDESPQAVEEIANGIQYLRALFD